MILEQIEPKPVWQYFEALNAIPRASKKEEHVIQFMLDFGARLGLDTIQDKVGNVIIRKAATAGMETRKTVVLQSHLDMVHQKNNDTDFDFDTQGISMFIENGWVKAHGTTLGADNGIGVAAIMAVLASESIPHPAIEALFTIDEETGMTGAKGLQGSLLEGEVLLNLDTEDDNEIDIGCAGGVDVTARRTYIPETSAADLVYYRLTVKGLHGGHSGMEIHKGLGNANKIINRLLYSLLPLDIRLSSIDGGGLRNAIPRESMAIFAAEETTTELLLSVIEQESAAIKQEFATVDEHLEIVLERYETSSDDVLPIAVQTKLIQTLYATPNGVYRMSADFDNLVETSNNIARVKIGKGKISVKCLTRSSVESSKVDLANTLKCCFELMDAEVTFSGDYPGWTPNPDSKILDVLRSTYTSLFGEEPHVVACHAGLECGILGSHYPEMDMISFGPTILGAHSPQERVSISSVQKFWTFLLEILKEIPMK
ncbi:aminoacyl-histidine dipeptidase [Sphingobacterium corticibacterium]|uniref:Cytosol non-specific dipeptidase n=1 Tax=Sphingobacterium corticibacterium TaxID=2484746 RepID=A0A4Q6XP38_9SPHI|nr:aminoacyl-histidine dipeptidase [Sphingobacterium corticibacterium]RZF61950.1 aminoacyl-histidine dipeptidase [Sphingobacterium corticibacterium]